ncbi:MAG TPA: UMP kinase [Candidatus Hydrothermia bacterium]|nr:UMP kinase [Candidatus Hydrothermia bacterium]MDD5572441.1 UMP kinase [Candidatus Hydrothermia bacterium]HOK23378.1 UMP kinase [Candidatus Hydrothermia bacterium]HOL24188.1 UMP kinase [Candidatus Hydrothermia bacterium]HOP32035.1 UMP kinase [Candidatus Hydrothermia bacterium]
MKSNYCRVLLKASGELFGNDEENLDISFLSRFSKEVSTCVEELHTQIAIVVGGGNIIRGKTVEKLGFDRISADYMGMLATAINSIALQNMLEKEGIESRIVSAIEIKDISEPFILRRVLEHLNKNRVVIFACGTGHPLFTTDTAAALRAGEIKAELLMKGTKVDGVYDKDPKVHKDAKKIDYIDLKTMLDLDLQVMDQAAITLCRENRIPILVFDITKEGNLLKALSGERIGTFVAI